MPQGNLAPIALFAYNRPELTLNTLEHLAQNKEVADSRLFIFCDGPKPNATLEQLKRIAQVQEVIRSKQWCRDVHIEQSTKNKGLANSIIAGVTNVVNQFGRLIVLEDDLIVSPYFLQYMNDALQLYENEDKVLAIHGNLYPIDLGDSTKTDTFFIRDPGCWGWATWKKKWELFEPDTKVLYTLIRQKGLSKPFNFWGGYPFMRMMRQQISGEVDSWAVRWRAVAYLNDKLTLYPTLSLVRHAGNTPDATHSYTGKYDPYYCEISNQPIKVKSIPIVNNEKIEHIFGSFLKKYSGMSIRSKVKKRIYNIFSKE